MICFQGGGYYSEILSYAVGPEGQIISHTNDVYESSTGKEANSRFKANRLPNVSRVTSEIKNLGLEKSSLDIILMVLTYHAIYFMADCWPKVDRDNFFRQIRESLKPGGILAVIDHSAIKDAGSFAALLNSLISGSNKQRTRPKLHYLDVLQLGA